MSEVKKVLVIDDHFEMLELLRSMLELSNDECEVLAVPSAEEGMLEFRRTHFDLVITDVRLPGMSGFDLVRRLRRWKPDTPVIMITAYSSTEGQKEAQSLGVLHYFPKPLDTDAVLVAVQTALHGDVMEAGEAAETYQVNGETAVSDAVRKRLQALRTDTGATGMMLASTDGQILFEATNNRKLDFSKFVPALAQTIQQSFLLSRHLESELPNTIQYHAGDTVELYCANVGQNYFLTIFFDIQSRRGRIGTIWVFTQRAIKDLIDLLPQTVVAGPPAAPIIESLPPARPRYEPQAKPEPKPKPRRVAPPPPPPEPQIEEDLVQDEEIAAMVAAMIAAQENGGAAADVEEETAVAEDWLDLGVSELDDLFGMDLPADEESADLDAFWDNALSPDSDEIAE